ncbi:hypothetical protein V1478_012208, partial [Vespula squamosa]
AYKLRKLCTTLPNSSTHTYLCIKYANHITHYVHTDIIVHILLIIFNFVVELDIFDINCNKPDINNIKLHMDLHTQQPPCGEIWKSVLRTHMHNRSSQLDIILINDSSIQWFNNNFNLFYDNIRPITKETSVLESSQRTS